MNAQSRQRRRGITRVEAGVVLVVVLLALGLVVVAIDHGREQARRLRCAANLKAIGAAAHRFADNKAHTGLPAARIADRYATWAVQIAPYLPQPDEDSALKRWDLQLSYYDQPAEVREAQVPFYFCPARRQPPQNSVSGDVPADGRPSRNLYPGALGDYACNAGNGDPAHPWDGPDANGAIILGEVVRRDGTRILSWRSRTRFQTLPRGQAYTVLVGEKHVPLGHFGEAAEGDGSLYNGDYPASSARIGGPGHGLAHGPADPFNLNFGSYHPGICQFLYADDHVEARANSVSEDVLGRMLNRLE